ncbi:hypothetical protein BGZ46_008224 [Entomortierella lignicola]|nr:hypothetical protein BGZ46_008224 [Entomortierella lignicola]
MNCDSPWNIPELTIQIAQYLDRAQLWAAAIVCKSWNAAFSPFLYLEVKWDDGRPTYPTLEVTQKYVGYIRTMIIGNVAYEFYRAFPWLDVVHLQEIQIQNGISTIPIRNLVFGLFSRNRKLRKVSLKSKDDNEAYQLVKELISSPNVRILELSMGDISHQTVTGLFDICNQLREMMIISGNFNIPHNLDSWKEFKFMTTLTLTEVSTCSQLEIIRRCPRLKRLNWTTVNRIFPTSEFCEVMIMECCELVELRLMPDNDRVKIAFSDEQLEQIIKSRNNLVNLEVFSEGFGTLASEALSQHYSSLTRLYVNRGQSLSSEVTHEILLSCPHLTDLAAQFLDARDILGIIGDERPTKRRIKLQSPPKEWVCQNLIYLDVFICGLKTRRKKWQPLILQQLSKLQKLRRLRIGVRDFKPEHSHDGIDLRLEHGLDILSNLKELRTIEFVGLHQRLNEADAEWMLREWPKLRLFLGRANSTVVKCREVERIFNKKGVVTGSRW